MIKYPAMFYDIKNDTFIAVKSDVLFNLVYSTPLFRLATDEEIDNFKQK